MDKFILDQIWKTIKLCSTKQREQISSFEWFIINNFLLLIIIVQLYLLYRTDINVTEVLKTGIVLSIICAVIYYSYLVS